ncbi:hypothetical protein SAMN02745216_03026 [Desulfatibacillum alkenivorans DSM 16219]|jgi:hypothetical protein|uniref:Dolichyl-phosphate-mannose-protein mannosyltransferase n=1 Tax=Desulfatibacillum alkenivorans DSM 16219 TaxID=1121393 RepID=A0A1M6QBR7_9BACT|nr:hypothetical protein [Desulfatibacillum alkenivorans]SHK17606.1 hypothetical protein SAMN02745216_03026 [Desulfatibacillum alkenivorans DSM 16219]
MQETIQTSNERRFKTVWFVTVLSVCLIAVIILHDDYGIAWDGARLADYGDAVLEYFTSGFTSQAYKQCDDAHYYGPLVEVLSSAVYSHFPGHRFEIRHLISALTGLLALAGMMSLAALFKERKVLIFSTLALIMMPRFVGHAFINTKDIPFACGFAWTMFSMALLFRGRRFSWFKFLFFGLCLGLTLAVRTGGLLALCFLVPVGGFYFLANKPWREEAAGGLAYKGVALGLKLVSASAIAWLVMVAFWPWAHESPLLHPIEAFKLASQFNRPYLVLFQGNVIQSPDLPWYYLPWYLLIGAPLPTIILMAVGVAASIFGVLKAFRDDESLLYVCLLLWFWFPIGYVIATHPNIYDGIRHFLFILPAMALLAGIGAAWLVQVMKSKARNAAVITLTGLLVLPLVDMIELHPYQMTYFNGVAGGVGGAYGKYDTDYWLTSYKECMEWLNNNTDPKDGPIKVLVAMEPLSVNCAKYFAAPHIQIVLVNKRPSEAYMPDFLDYYVGSSRFSNHACFPKNQVVYIVQRQGAVFSVVRQNKPMAAPPEGAAP